MSKLLEEIIGTWSLQSWTYTDQEGKTIDYLGRNPLGTLTYTASGRMSVQIMKSDRKKFASGDLVNGTQDEIKEAFSTFFAYFGTFTEKEPGILAHQIEGSNFPNWVGETEIREANLENNELTLSAPGVLSDGLKVIFYVKWRRA